MFITGEIVTLSRAMINTLAEDLDIDLDTQARLTAEANKWAIHDMMTDKKLQRLILPTHHPLGTRQQGNI
eukprot:COSAG01_NODE_20653_length_942_cov_2.890866_1_plen_70_part_00